MDADIKALDFEGIRRLLERLTFSPYGADAARNLEPAPSLAVAREMQAAVSAARLIVDAYESPRISAVPDVRAALRQAGQSGAALSPMAFANIRQVIRFSAELAELVDRYPGLYRERERLLAPPALVGLLDASISPAGRLKDEATPELAAMTSQFQSLSKQIETQVKARMAQPDVAALFGPDSRIHWQGARIMLSVRAADADRIKGVRRSTLAGGRDCLIEPIEVVPHNNQLEKLNGQVEAQHQIVLRGLTDGLRGHLDALQGLVDALTWIDLALAGGQFSAALGAVAPRLVETPSVRLEAAYHPQLLMQFRDRQIREVKPLSLRLDAGQSMLVITGPNTGGKTVVLKTVGLLVVLAHCGLHIPAEGACEIGQFSRVIVDVGDKQSLHHHLSTFAGHVEVLKRLLAEADEHTLVLMDELGTGTDPEEGASLAMAVLDELATRGVRGIVTTHLSPLKGFADEHPYLTNASMRFDFASLSPTYELECGRAGQSLGLIIAEKNGLPGSLVNRAREYLLRMQVSEPVR
jgi:DNA mismatch repair protein MutS2